MENRDLILIASIFLGCLIIVGYLFLSGTSQDTGVNETIDKYTKEAEKASQTNENVTETLKNNTQTKSLSKVKQLRDVAIKYKNKLNKAVIYLNDNYKNLIGRDVKFKLKDIDIVPGYIVLYLNATSGNLSAKVVALLSKNNNTLLIGQIVPTSKILGENISGSNSDEIANKVVGLLNTKNENITIKLKGYDIEHDLLVLHLNISNNKRSSIESIVLTQDGKYFVLNILPLDITKKIEPPKPPEQPKQKPIPKSEKPKVEVFVMSYCPFGVQMERAILPVIDLFKDKVDFEIKFVDYAMHGKKEVDENLRQYCVQKIDKTEYWKYLKCFIKTGNYSLCLNNISIDLNTLNKCMDETDKEFNVSYYRDNKSTYLSGIFPRFLVNDEGNKKYGVQGSPTTFINGVEYVGARSPETIKETICNAFKEKPEECNVNLSNNPVPYGIGEVGQGSGSCG